MEQVVHGDPSPLLAALARVTRDLIVSPHHHPHWPTVQPVHQLDQFLAAMFDQHDDLHATALGDPLRWRPAKSFLEGTSAISGLVGTPHPDLQPPSALQHRSPDELGSRRTAAQCGD